MYILQINIIVTNNIFLIICSDNENIKTIGFEQQWSSICAQ